MAKNIIDVVKSKLPLVGISDPCLRSSPTIYVYEILGEPQIHGEASVKEIRYRDSLELMQQRHFRDRHFLVIYLMQKKLNIVVIQT